MNQKTNDLKGLCGAHSTGEEDYNNNIHNNLNNNHNNYSANNNNNIVHNDLIMNDNVYLHNIDDDSNNNNNSVFSQHYFSLTSVDSSGRNTLDRADSVLDRSVDNKIDQSSNERMDIDNIGSVQFPDQKTRKNKRQYESDIEPNKRHCISVDLSSDDKHSKKNRLDINSTNRELEINNQEKETLWKGQRTLLADWRLGDESKNSTVKPRSNTNAQHSDVTTQYQATITAWLAMRSKLTRNNITKLNNHQLIKQQEKALILNDVDNMDDTPQSETDRHEITQSVISSSKQSDSAVEHMLPTCRTTITTFSDASSYSDENHANVPTTSQINKKSIRK